jgi:hypothetical protein
MNEFLAYMKLNHQGNNPLHRNFMSKTEIRYAEKFVKMGLLVKGTAVEDARLKIYYFQN